MEEDVRIRRRQSEITFNKRPFPEEELDFDWTTPTSEAYSSSPPRIAGLEKEGTS